MHGMLVSNLTVLEDSQATHACSNQDTNTGHVELCVAFRILLLVQARLHQGLPTAHDSVLEAVVVAPGVLGINKAASVSQ